MFTFYTADGTPQDYNVLFPVQADTWKKIIVSVPGDQDITFDTNTDYGLQLMWNPYMGNHYTSGSSVNRWQNHAGYTSRPDMDDKWWRTASTFEITGVQLEVGPNATEFEHRSYGEELLLCQRYYEGIIMGTGTALMRTYTNTAGSPTNVSNVEYNFKVEKRTTPTWTVEGNASWYPSGTSGMSAYPSTSMCLFQRNDTTHQFFSDGAGDLCGSFSCEL